MGKRKNKQNHKHQPLPEETTPSDNQENRNWNKNTLQAIPQGTTQPVSANLKM